MCGILGILDTSIAGDEALARTLRAMGRWQFHRGPDDWGEWVENGVALGHNRLSIIDLAGGSQPMASPDGAIQVVFNGEIYNYRDLWRELESRARTPAIAQRPTATTPSPTTGAWGSRAESERSR